MNGWMDEWAELGAETGRERTVGRRRATCAVVPGKIEPWNDAKGLTAELTRVEWKPWNGNEGPEAGGCCQKGRTVRARRVPTG